MTMLGTRYEEYTKFEGNLPFAFMQRLKVTPTCRSHEANWHENLEIQICAEGAGYVSMDEKSFEFKKNKIAVVNSNVIHHTNSEEYLEYDCLIIDTLFCRSAGIDPTVLEFESCFFDENILKLFSKLSEMQSDDDLCSIAKKQCIILEILIELRENHTVKENPNIITKKSFDTVKSAIKYIRHNYGEKLSLDKISQNIYIDKFTLSREFKRLTGTTVVSYLNSYRCKKAAECISDGNSVSDAALMCGFTNMSFFTKTFKMYMGCLPSAYK